MDYEVASTRYLETAREYYDMITEFDSDALFNKEAPSPAATFTVGAVLSVAGFIMWVFRVMAMKKYFADKGLEAKGSDLIRCMISCLNDNDNALYTIVSYSAISFVFLGGLQINYGVTWLTMICSYFVTSFGDSFRVLLAYRKANSLADVVTSSQFLASQIRSATTELKPTNVYEDLGRSWTIVNMVFATQVILISFVCVDVYDSPLSTCLDGTPNCPVVGTLGSYGFYVLGIFMACVFLLGPKTSFGQSEQNPAYWLHLLLAAKHSGSKVTWYDPIADKQNEAVITSHDFRIWLRFFLSYLINGVGFHILVHALPIQVADQTSLLGVVFRAVGMMYLVDLDDTSGYILTIVQKPSETAEASAPPAEQPPATGPAEEPAPAAELNDEALKQFAVEADRIIEEAKFKLGELEKNKYGKANYQASNKLYAGALMLGDRAPLNEPLLTEGEREGYGTAEQA